MTTVYAVVSAEVGTVGLYPTSEAANSMAYRLNFLDQEDSYYVQEEPLWDPSWDPDCELP